MDKNFAKLAAVSGALVLAMIWVPGTHAQCPIYRPSAIHGNLHLPSGQAVLQRVAFDDQQDDEPSIVGFWHIRLMIGPNEIAFGNEQWHSDGTELINDGIHPPFTGNICLGVWKKVGERHYKLNHRGIAWNASGTALQEVDVILMDVTLSADGNSYSGTFSISPFDPSGNSLGGPVAGTVSGTRITVEDTNPGSLL